MTTVKPPIKSGWKGDINGPVEIAEKAKISVSEITLKLDLDIAWALCNVLLDNSLADANTDREQAKSLSTLGAALGRLIDHPAANNGNREIIK